MDGSRSHTLNAVQENSSNEASNEREFNFLILLVCKFHCAPPSSVESELFFLRYYWMKIESYEV